MKYGTTIKDLKEMIKDLSDDCKFLVSSDEELNTIYKGFEVADLKDIKNSVVIYGLTGTEQEF